VHTGTGGLVIEVSDAGLGMTEADMRMANTRLGSGGEVTPFTARHMGLFVVGRLAEQHGLVVRLRSSVLGQPDSGTTAGVYVPAELIAHGPAHGRPRPQEFDELVPDPRAGTATARALDEVPNGAAAWHSEPELSGQPYRNGTAHDEVSTSTLPRRNPGASGIADGQAAPPAAATPREPVVPAAHAEDASESWPPEPRRAPADTSAYFSSRAQAASNGMSRAAESDRRPYSTESQPEVKRPQVDAERPVAPAAKRTRSAEPGDTDVIYQRMLSEWLIDMDTLTQPPQSWESVWDNGWAAAAHAVDAPVEARTDQGLAMRRPGARLVPGSAEGEPGPFGHPNGAAHRKPDNENGVASASGDPLLQRDPDAVRTSLSNHWGGVRAGRSHARETHEEMDSE
jgi:hypothetical protein